MLSLEQRFPEERNETMPELSNLRVATVVTDGFEESELVEPVNALEKAGAQVEVIAPKPGTVQAFRHLDKGKTVPVDRLLHDARAEDYDALLLPGGALNADALRMLPEAQSFLRDFQTAGKPIAVICHAPWLLVSAGLVRGRKLTSYHTIQDDIRNAGGEWLDQEVVEDGNWVTSRQPSDIPAFNRAMLRLFARQATGAARGSPIPS
jgi:protease I